MKKVLIKIKKEDFKKKLEIEDGKDGSTPIKNIDYFDGKDGSPDTPEQVRDKLESLIKGKKLSITAIEDLSNILEKLSKLGNGKLLGSTHTIPSNVIRFKDDETPTGTVNGSNTIFITSKTPLSGSLKVYRGGARQRVTEDYTFLGRTITFLQAPQVGEIILVDYRY